MAARFNHFAVVPCRAGSKGFPGKNRLFFNFTADFLDRTRQFARVLVTTDDSLIADWAVRRGDFVRPRPEALATDTARIKDVVVDLVATCDFLAPDDFLWLVYNTTLHKSLSDFRDARRMLDAEDPVAFCTFIPVATHPYIAWYQESGTGKMRQFIPNDVVNRQDFPPAVRNYHYIIGFKVRALPSLNGNLLGEDTRPIFLDGQQQDALCDLDAPADIAIWKRKHPDEFAEWRHTLPAGIDLAPVRPYLDPSP